MYILVDENIPRMTVTALREAGHDVLDIRGTDQEGLNDASLWQLAQEQGRLLITTDKGFAQRRHEGHHGILIVRLKKPNRQRIHQRIMDGMASTPTEDWPFLLVTMRDHLHSLWRPSVPSATRTPNGS